MLWSEWRNTDITKLRKQRKSRRDLFTPIRHGSEYHIDSGTSQRPICRIVDFSDNARPEIGELPNKNKLRYKHVKYVEYKYMYFKN